MHLAFGAPVVQSGSMEVDAKPLGLVTVALGKSQTYHLLPVLLGSTHLRAIQLPATILLMTTSGMQMSYPNFTMLVSLSPISKRLSIVVLKE